MAIKPKTIDELGELQRAVMEIVWDSGQATVKDVLAVISSRRDTPPAYTTILTVMQKLEKAGFIRHLKDRPDQQSSDIIEVDPAEKNFKRRAYRYEPVRSRKYEQSRALRAFIERVWTDKELLGNQADGDSLETISRLTATRAKVLLFKHLLDDDDLGRSHLNEISDKLNSRLTIK